MLHPAKKQLPGPSLALIILLVTACGLATACGPAGELFQLGRAMGDALGAGPTDLNLVNRTELTLTFQDVPVEAMDATGEEGFARRAAEFVRDNWEGAGALEVVKVEVVENRATGLASAASTAEYFQFSMAELRRDAPPPADGNAATPGAASSDTGG